MVAKNKGMHTGLSINAVHLNITSYKLMDPMAEEAIAKALNSGRK